MKYFLVALFSLFLLSACQPDANSSKKKETKADQTKADKKRPAKAGKLVEKATSEQLDLVEMLSTATKVEFLFYTDPNNPSISSISTETENVPQIRNFSRYITNEELEKPDCIYMGSALFKNPDGDILFDGEFNLSQECVHFKMLYKGKTSYRKLTPAGLEFLTQFYMMVTNQVRGQMGGGQQ